MRKIKYFMFGFFGFLVVTGINASASVLIYSLIEDRKKYQIALFLILLIIINAFLCSVIDVIRRRIMIQRPLKEILYATKAMTKGNFKIKLIPNHSFDNFDEFDLIKEDLNTMAKELDKSELLKNDFIANISHEIKTPLAIINNYAQILDDKSLEWKEREKYIKNLQDSCKKLSVLINNILKLNKLENQTLQLEYKKINLSELLVEQIIIFEELINNKNIELECEIEEGLFIISESSYLEIIFNNLISNAIKFTKDKIYVSLSKQENKYTITVKDNGCGMDKEKGKYIFEKFYQIDTSHKQEGNGLGLALVKKVIDLLGGEISVTSELGKGSTFKITIKEN